MHRYRRAPQLAQIDDPQTMGCAQIGDSQTMGCAQTDDSQTMGCVPTLQRQQATTLYTAMYYSTYLEKCSSVNDAAISRMKASTARQPDLLTVLAFFFLCNYYEHKLPCSTSDPCLLPYIWQTALQPRLRKRTQQQWPFPIACWPFREPTKAAQAGQQAAKKKEVYFMTCAVRLKIRLQRYTLQPANSPPSLQHPFCLQPKPSRN